MRLSEFLERVKAYLDGGIGNGGLSRELRYWSDRGDKFIMTDSGRELLADIEAHQARVAHLEAVEKAARVYVGAYCKAVYGNNTDPSPVCAAEWNALCEALDPEPKP